ncbi:OR85D protein, partial [Acromyrmex charruanus]
ICWTLSKQMEYPEHYYKINRLILSFYGLWPFQSKWSAHLMRASTIITLLSNAIFQLLTFSTTNITKDFIIDVMSEFIPAIAGLSHIYARIKRIDKLRDLFERIRDDWKLQKTSFEIKIMHKYAETSRLFSLYCLSKKNILDLALSSFSEEKNIELRNLQLSNFSVLYIIMIACNLQIFLPYILDVILPMNESRPRTQPFQLEFFTIEERYPTLITFYVFIIVIISSIIYCANSVLCVTLTQHACGMCELLGYRAECLFYDVEHNKDLTTQYDLIRSKINYGNMAIFIQMHYNIIEYVDSRNTSSVSKCKNKIFQVLTIGSDIDRAFRSISVAVIALIYLFISNYMAQKITDMSLNVCEKVYNSAWYNANVLEQKPLLLIMKRRFRPFVLTACRFYIMSLQNFGMIIMKGYKECLSSKILRTAISYCMFMRQL